MSNDKNNLVYREQLDDNVIEMLSEDIGSNYSLRTENTKTIVAALNEILGKDIICNAVGSPLLTTDTFAQIGEKIHVMVNDFKAKLLGLGVSVSSVDKLARLIEKVGEIDLGVNIEDLTNTFEESLRELLGEYGVETDGNESLSELIVKIDDLLATKQVIVDKAEEHETNQSYLYYILKSVGFDINENDDEKTIYKMLEYLSKYPINVKQVACGGSSTFILKNDGSLWACGDNQYSQLGLGDTDNRTIFIKVTDDVKQVDCGHNHTFIIKNDNSLWACGRNYYGQLGLGDTTDRKTFTKVTDNVKQVDCGHNHTFILKNDGSVWACGRNYHGQLGLGDTDRRTLFTKVTDDVKQVDCGLYCSFIIKNDNSLWACGYNGEGNLGLGNTTTTSIFTRVTDNVKSISSGGYIYGPSVTTYASTFIIKNDNSLWACGYNSTYGILGLGDNDDRHTFTQVTTNINNDVSQVSCSGYHTCILKTDGSVWTCGNNTKGQLGTGDVDKRTTFTKVLDNVKQISCSHTSSLPHTVVIKNDDTLLSCGNNDNGQLGLGVASDTIQTNFTRLNSFNI